MLGSGLVAHYHLDIARPIEVVYREKEALQEAPAALLAPLLRWRWNQEGYRASRTSGDFADPAKPDEHPPWAQQPVRVDE